VSTPVATSTAHPLIGKHQQTLDRALQAIRERGYWSAYTESPSPRQYGEAAAEEGRLAFEGRLGKPLHLGQPGVTGLVGEEVSPYGLPLGITYPHVTDFGALLGAMRAAMPAWRDAGPELRAAVCAEILERINQRSFEVAHAVMHTTGQAFVMAFQAGGPHAQDRGLEAVAYGYDEMRRVPRSAYWEKPQGKRDPLRMRKDFHIVPRGVALVIGCNTFPTWNAYPGLFASLVTGNPVLVKPHPRAILPLALTVQACREVLAETGFSADLVALVAEAPGGRVAAELAVRDEVRIIDFTGSTAFGQWLEANAGQAQVYTEKAGVNPVVIDSTDDFGGMCANLAFALSLYSGQMCTTPQNVLVPRDGITAGGAHQTFDEVAQGIAGAVSGLLADDARAVELLGAIVNPDVLTRIDRAPGLGQVVLQSRAVAHPQFPDAVIRTPVIIAVGADDEGTYGRECFVGGHGALTAAVYSADESVLGAAERAAVDAGVALSANLTDGVYVNQSAAFSDFHATGANPAANAALTDAAFVAGRFRVVQSRSHVPGPPQPS
jgi:phenylacetic acid degradation protein paaN